MNEAVRASGQNQFQPTVVLILAYPPEADQG